MGWGWVEAALEGEELEVCDFGCLPPYITIQVFFCWSTILYLKFRKSSWMNDIGLLSPWRSFGLKSSAFTGLDPLQAGSPLGTHTGNGLETTRWDAKGIMAPAY